MFLKMLKDIKMEMDGIDVESHYRAEREREEQKKKEYAENNFLPKELKQIVNIIGISFILWNLLTAALFFKGAGTFKIVFNTAIVAIDIIALILLNLKNKKSQKIGTALFVAYLFLFFVCSF